MTEPDRGAVRSAHREHLEAQLAALKDAAEAAQDAMRVDGDHRPDSRGERGAVSISGGSFQCSARSGGSWGRIRAERLEH